MVRINIIPPDELYDQHLRAEYDEILMLCGSLSRTLKSKKGLQLNRISPHYKLGPGHIYFFYDKGKYLHGRFDSLKMEMIRRGFKPKKDFPKNIWPDFLYKAIIPFAYPRKLVI